MNMKKIVAAAVASVMAVSSMAIAASAAVFTATASNGVVSDKYLVEFDGFTEDQIKSITKIEAEVSSDTNYFKGIIGFNNATTGNWDQGDEIEIGDGASDEFNISGKFVREFEAGTIAAVGEDGSVAPYVEIQFWWVNGVEYEGTKITKDGTVNIDSVKFYNAAGEEVVAGGAADPAPETSADETEAPADTSAEGSNPSGGDGKDPANTGIEGVAVVAGLAVLATGAIVVAKKRK